MALLAVSGGARAQSLTPQRTLATEVGLAGAGVASVRGPGALWVNPAGLDPERWGALTGVRLEMVGRSVRLQGPAVNEPLPEARDAAGARWAPGVAASIPVWPGRLALAIGYGTGLALESYYPEVLDPQTQVRTDAPRYLGSALSLVEHRVSVALAARWRWLAVGAALELIHTRLEHRRSLWAGLEPDLPELHDPAADLDLEARFGGRTILTPTALFGVSVTPASWIDLAAALRLPVTADVEGRVELSAGETPPAGHDSISARGGVARLELPLPLVIRGGAALDLGLIRLHAELGYSRWSAADALELQLEGAGVVLESGGVETTTPLRQLRLGVSLRDQLAVRWGLERGFWDDALTVRAGYAWTRGATLSSGPSPAALDLTHHTVAGGVSARVSWIELSMALSHALGAKLRSAGATRIETPLIPEQLVLSGEGRYASHQTTAVLQACARW